MMNKKEKGYQSFTRIPKMSDLKPDARQAFLLRELREWQERSRDTIVFHPTQGKDKSL